MRDHRSILAAYETLQKGKPVGTRDGDARVGSTHNRRSRGFIRVLYHDKEILFHPVKVWPTIVGVSSVALRNWLNKGLISAYKMHGMYVMSDAELHALKVVVAKWHGSRDMHNAIEIGFQKDLKDCLAKARLALDTYKRQLPMTPDLVAILQPSLKE